MGLLLPPVHGRGSQGGAEPERLAQCQAQVPSCRGSLRLFPLLLVLSRLHDRFFLRSRR